MKTRMSLAPGSLFQIYRRIEILRFEIINFFPDSPKNTREIFLVWFLQPSIATKHKTVDANGCRCPFTDSVIISRSTYTTCTIMWGRMVRSVHRNISLSLGTVVYQSIVIIKAHFRFRRTY